MTVKTTCTPVPMRALTRLTTDTSRTARVAVSLNDHSGISTRLVGSDEVAWKKSRLRYSPKMSAMIADEPGLRRETLQNGDIR